jgi:hypothetical protein
MKRGYHWQCLDSSYFGAADRHGIMLKIRVSDKQVVDVVADPIRFFIVLTFLYFVVAKWLIIGFAIARVGNFALCRLIICSSTHVKLT